MLAAYKLVIDTNVYSALLAGDKKVQKTIEQASLVLVPPIVIAELLVWFQLGKKEKQNLQLLSEFLEQPTVEQPPITMTTAKQFAQIFTHLKTIGKPIPINDVWIAACAKEHNAELLTLDKHFQLIPDLLI